MQSNLIFIVLFSVNLLSACAIEPSRDDLSSPSSTPQSTIEVSNVNKTIDGEMLMMEMITAVQQAQTSQIRFEFSGSGADGTIHCVIKTNETKRCEQTLQLANGESQAFTFLHHGDNDWIQIDNDKWVYQPDGLKTGYEGVNDMAFVRSITAVSQEELNGTSRYSISFEYEPEVLLRLILNEEEIVDELLTNAISISTDGVILIDVVTNLPIQELVSIAIELPDNEFEIDTTIVYEAYNEPVEFEFPTGELLFEKSHQFFNALNEGELERAYAFFSEEAKQAMSLSDFQNFIETNSVLFESFEEVSLGRYDPEPDVNGVDGDFDMIIVDIHYQDNKFLQFQLIFIDEHGTWQLLRFDELVAPTA